MHQILDDNLDRDRVGVLEEPSIQDKNLVLAPWLFRRVDTLLTIKQRSQVSLWPLHDRDVDEEEVYQQVRGWFLDSLRKSEQDDLLPQAASLLPDRLIDVTYGRVEWNRTAADELYAVLSARRTNAGLKRYKDKPAESFNVSGYDLGLDEKIAIIFERTAERLRMRGQVSEIIDEYERTVSQLRKQYEERWPWPPAPVPPDLFSELPATDGEPSPDSCSTPILLPPMAESEASQSEPQHPTVKVGRTGMSKAEVEAKLDEYVRMCHHDPKKRAGLKDFLAMIDVSEPTFRDWTRKRWGAPTNFRDMLEEARQRFARNS